MARNQKSIPSDAFLAGLRAATDPNGVYLGGLADVGALLRLAVSEDIDRRAAWSLGKMTDDEFTAQCIKAVDDLRDVFAGVTEGYGKVAGDWHPVGLAKWLRKRTSAQGDDANVILAAVGNLLLDCRKALDHATGQGMTDTEGAQYLGSVIDEYTYLLAGVAWPRPPDYDE